VAKRGGLAVVIAYVAYMLLVNVTLGLVRHVPLPEATDVTFASAWSWYPGQVQARGVRIVGNDSNVQWQLDVDQVRFRMSLTALVRRRFQASGVRGTGIAMRLRRKVDAADATSAALEVLPPIVGFPEPPLKPAVPSPPLSDEEYDLWSAELESVEALEIREVWFDAYRFTGDARVTGSFALRPLRMVRIGPTAVAVTRGALRAFGEAAAEGLSGHIDVTMAPLDPRAMAGASFLRFVSGAVRGGGHVPDLHFANHYLPAAAPKLSGGAGPVRVDLRIVGGVLAAPSTASVDSELMSVTATGHRASASAHVALLVEAKPERPEASVSVELTQLEARRAAVEAPLLRAPRIVVRGRSASLDLVSPFGDGTATLEVPSAELPDLRSLDAYLGDDAPSLRSGRARLRGELSASLPARSARGTLALVTDGLVVRMGSAEARATGYANVVLAALDVTARRADLSGSRFEARDVMLSDAKTAKGWWSRVALDDAHLSLAAPVRLKARFTLQAKDGRPVLKGAMPSWLADLVGLDQLEGGGSLTVDASVVQIAGLRVRGGGWDIRGELDKHGPRSHAIGLARSADVTVGFELSDGATSLKLLGAEDWYQRALGPKGWN
jgi:hypothetical protein